MLPENRIAKSSVTHRLYTTPDACTQAIYSSDGTELYWEYDEDRSRYYVHYPDDQ